MYTADIGWCLRSIELVEFVSTFILSSVSRNVSDTARVYKYVRSRVREFRRRLHRNFETIHHRFF